MARHWRTSVLCVLCFVFLRRGLPCFGWISGKPIKQAPFLFASPPFQDEPAQSHWGFKPTEGYPQNTYTYCGWLRDPFRTTAQKLWCLMFRDVSPVNASAKRYGFIPMVSTRDTEFAGWRWSWFLLVSLNQPTKKGQEIPASKRCQAMPSDAKRVRSPGFGGSGLGAHVLGHPQQVPELRLLRALAHGFGDAELVGSGWVQVRV